MVSKAIRKTKKRLLALDDQAREIFKPYADAPPMLALDWLSKLGDQPQLRLIASGIMVAGTLGESDRLVRAGARMMIAHEAATAVKDLVKTNVDRTRPRSSNGSTSSPKQGRHTAKEKTSFPSGHSAGAIAAARAFSREYPEYAPALLGAAGLIAALQVPRCAHYPTDVVAGVGLGLLVEAMNDAAWNAVGMEERSVS